MKLSRIIVAGIFSVGTSFLAIAPPRYDIPALRAAVSGEVETAALPLINAAVFDQLIDHDNPSLGTFQQRYWYSTEYWNGSGSPVILYNAGEGTVIGENVDLTTMLENVTLVGQYAQAVGGAAIIIEHRYWGESSPYTNLTAENLQYLTVPQAIQDMVSFAENAMLPFDLSGMSRPAMAPWVFVGSSYSGNLAAWTALTAPGTFWAYHASSAPVQSIDDFWQYFYPIQQGMPTNCTIMLESSIAHVDIVLSTGTAVEKSALKSTFGLGLVSHDDDFASALEQPLEVWQQNINAFEPFCDTMEAALSGSPSNVFTLSLNVTLSSYGRYVNSHYACESPDCYDTYSMTEYEDTVIDPSASGGRQWQWMLCHEGFNWWQTGAPVGQATIVSRLITTEYFERQCGLYFPGIQFNRTVDQQNLEYLGWNINNTTRLMLSNGEFDPWRSASVSSDFRPGGPLASTKELPIFIVPGATHGQDIYMSDPTSEVLSLRLDEIAQMKSWVDEFYQQVPSTTTIATSSSSSPISFLVTSSKLTSSETTGLVTTIATGTVPSRSITTTAPIYGSGTTLTSTIQSTKISSITSAPSPVWTTSTKFITETHFTTSCLVWFLPCHRVVMTETVPIFTATRLVSTPKSTSR